MSKAQTDIRTTSYDAHAARPFGYEGTLDDVLAQIREEKDSRHLGPTGRTELRHFLGLPPKHLSVSDGPSVEDDKDVRYGAPEPVYGAPEVQVEPLHKLLTVGEIARFLKLTDSQMMIYRSVRRVLPPSQALRVAESYPYPAPRD